MPEREEGAPSPRPRKTPRAFVWTLIAASAIALWIRSGFPAEVWAGAGADDLLFVRLARFLVSGRWLGQFDELTLVKGIGYPAFIAFSFVLGIPLKVAETALYLSCSAATAYLTAKWSRSFILGAVLFTFLALNPAPLSESMSRVVRETFYTSVSLGAVLLPIVQLMELRQVNWRSLVLVVATGVVWAWFWLTREEGLWLIPSIGTAIAITLYGLHRIGHVGKWRQSLSYLRSLSASLVVAAGLIGLVALTNKVQYGRFETVEVKSKPFEHAYGAIYRVVPTHRVRYVVFPKDARERLYEVSLTARELQPYFEGPRAEYWRQVGCRSGYQAQCSEIVAAFFQWAFREAVAKAGHYKSAADSAAFYERLASEIDAACELKTLSCLPPRETLTPPFELTFIPEALSRIPTFAEAYWRTAMHIVPPGQSVVIPGEAQTDVAQVTMFADMIGGDRPTSQEAASNRGASFKRDNAILKIATLLAKVYAPILLILIIFSPFAFSFLWSRARDARHFALLALLSSCAVATLMRAGLLCYLDTTAIPALNAQYASPASALLIIFATGSTIGAAVQWQANRSKSSRPDQLTGEIAVIKTGRW